nr:tRNA (adenosine(37)-N6)-dimethylallyltransferase MiaA [Mesorhizobium sp. NBSH29]
MAKSAEGEPEGLVKDAILIAGPTASGKSALALAIARLTGGTIINTDSMQVYGILNVLSARPGPAELLAAPHHLYGHIDPGELYSTGRWVADVRRLRGEGVFDANRPIFVGGTGLYFRALAGGLSEMPEIPNTIRDRWRYRLTEEGPGKLYQILMSEDSRAAMTLSAGDSQRVLRALEVLQASGRSILDWQAEKGLPLVDHTTARCLVLEPDRAVLTERINARFDRMLDAGGLAEVEALTALNLDPALPAMKAIGVRELQSAIAGAMPFDEAIERGKISTRQYAKRQSTWFRNQLGPDWTRIASNGPINAPKLAANFFS